MNRQEAISNLKGIKAFYGDDRDDGYVQEFVVLDKDDKEAIDMAIEALSAEKTGWIPVSERLPSDDEIVNITWVNHNPPPYYADIAEKPFVASGLRYCGEWYWYSSVCQDLHEDFDLIDKDIEVIAWQPLPEPYKDGDTE